MANATSIDRNSEMHSSGVGKVGWPSSSEWPGALWPASTSPSHQCAGRDCCSHECDDACRFMALNKGIGSGAPQGDRVLTVKRLRAY
eukprot:9084366-Lingulodinium_polyedra.AAC.1